MSGKLANNFILLIPLAVYFAFYGAFHPTPIPSNTLQTISKPITAKPIPAQAVTPPCPLQIVSVGQSGTQIKATVLGSANKVWVSWPGGVWSSPTDVVCSGGDCTMNVPKLYLPMRLQFDNCPALVIQP